MFLNFDTILVIIFFVFFLLLTFYYVGIRMKLFRNFFGKLFETRPKPQKLSPELISSKYNRLSDFLTGRNKLYFLPYSLSLFLSKIFAYLYSFFGLSISLSLT